MEERRRGGAEWRRGGGEELSGGEEEGRSRVEERRSLVEARRPFLGIGTHPLSRGAGGSHLQAELVEEVVAEVLDAGQEALVQLLAGGAVEDGADGGGL